MHPKILHLESLNEVRCVTEELGHTKQVLGHNREGCSNKLNQFMFNQKNTESVLGMVIYFGHFWRDNALHLFGLWAAYKKRFGQLISRRKATKE